MPPYQSTNHERENLEAHVDLCEARYGYLEDRLNDIEDNVDSIYKIIRDSHDSIGKVIITSTATVVASLIGAIITVIIKF